MKKNAFRTSMVFMALVCIIVPSVAQTNYDIKTKITRINQEMAKAMIEGNTEKSLSFYTQDAISMPNNSKMIEGLAAIRKSTEEMKASGVKVNSFEVQTLNIFNCDNMIIEIGKFAIRFSIPGVPDQAEDTGKYLTVWETQPDGTLKIKLETWNSDAAPVKENIVSEIE
jgi:ketosteroid isomerase-like protein